MDAFTGEIRLFPFNFAPMNWALCDGSTLQVQQNTVLYSVIANTYGGTPGQTFNLPNLNGRAAMGAGNGIGLTPRPIGNIAGADQVTLQPANIAGHSHTVQVKDGSEASASLDTPNSTAYLAQPRNLRLYNNTVPVAGGPTLAAGTIGSAGELAAGSTVARSTLQPFLTLAYCICLNGEYPVKP